MSEGGADLYDLLGVESTASAEEIRSAYRRVAFDCHPDRNSDPDAAERFKAATQAHEILSDPVHRAEYDRMSAYAGFPDIPFFGRQPDLGEVVDAVGVVFGSVMGAVKAQREGRKLPKDGCPVCQGSGEIIVDLAIISFARTCPACEGTKKAGFPPLESTNT